MEGDNVFFQKLGVLLAAVDDNVKQGWLMGWKLTSTGDVYTFEWMLPDGTLGTGVRSEGLYDALRLGMRQMNISVEAYLKERERKERERS